MTEAIDQLIRERFDAVANPSNDADWSEVLARMQAVDARAPKRPALRGLQMRRMPRRVALAVAITVLAATAAAVALGWPQTFIDFFTSPSAPESVKISFGAQNVVAPIGMSPEAIPGEAREIMSATFDATGIHPDKPTVHTLYVAPTKSGGFCYEWSHSDGGCAPGKITPTTQALQALGPLGLGWMGNDYPLMLSGWVRAGETQKVEARFADGTSATIPITWVSAPINAGFLVYPVPTEHQTRADALTSVVALDADDHVLGKQNFPLTDPLDEQVAQTLPDGTKESLSRRADAAAARKIISFKATDGSDVWLWVMPREGGGVCFVYNQGGGCPPPVAMENGPAFAGGFSIGTKRVLFFAQAKPDVAAIELRYQNGDTEPLTPIEGFVLHEVTPAHYKPGTRLVAAVGLDRNGKEIFRQPFQPQQTGVYPCDTPIDRGYGVESCP
jgi:hypothetical protein